jgi:hypothetical protein
MWKISGRIRLTAFVLFSMWAAVGIAAQRANECDRACLKTMLDQYLTAVTTHNPSAAPLFAGFRQTENAVVVKLGTGVWKSVTGLGKVQRRYMDAVSGQAAYFGIVEEGTASAVVTARIRVEDRKITEAEWYIARADDPGLNGPRQPGQGPANLFNPDAFIANPPPDRVSVPKDKRASRELLLAITNSYFDGLTTHDGTIIMAHPGCTRTENGTAMGGPRGGGGGRGGAAAGRGGQAGAAPTAPQAPTDCTSGLANFNAQLVAARRYPVVDEEAQVVLAFALFIRRPGSPTPRNAFSEWFYIDDNKIRSIYTAMFYPAPELPVPNWPPYEGNWPLPATIVPAPPATAPR